MLQTATAEHARSGNTDAAIRVIGATNATRWATALATLADTTGRPVNELQAALTSHLGLRSVPGSQTPKRRSAPTPTNPDTAVSPRFDPSHHPTTGPRARATNRVGQESPGPATMRGATTHRAEERGCDQTAGKDYVPDCESPPSYHAGIVPHGPGYLLWITTRLSVGCPVGTGHYREVRRRGVRWSESRHG